MSHAHQVRQLTGLTGQSRPDARDRARDLLDAFRLTDAAGRAVKTYSGGMRRQRPQHRDLHVHNCAGSG